MFTKNNRELFWVIFALSFLIVLPAIDFSMLSKETTVLKFLSQIFSLSGIVMLMWQHILGARGFITIFTKDWIFVNAVHKLIGKFGVLGIFLHPLFIILFYLQFKVNLLNLDLSTEFNRAKFLGQIAIATIGFIWVTSAILRSKIKFRPWKNIHLLGYIVLPLVLLHSFLLSRVVYSTYLQFYWIFMAVVYVTIVIIRLLMATSVLKTKYVVKNVTKLNYNVTELIINPLNKGIKNPVPGQFIYFQTRLGGEAHPYTIASFDESNGDIKIVAKEFGSFSSQLDELVAGSKVFVDGPYGNFTTEAFAEKKDIVLLAGGVGITPFIQIIENIERFKDRRVFLFFFNREKKDIIYKDFFESIAAKNKNFTFINILSSDDEFTGEKGVVSKELLEKYLSPYLGDRNFFICGPKPMMYKAKDILKNAMVSPTNIFTEEFAY